MSTAFLAQINKSLILQVQDVDTPLAISTSAHKNCNLLSDGIICIYYIQKYLFINRLQHRFAEDQRRSLERLVKDKNRRSSEIFTEYMCKREEMEKIAEQNLQEVELSWQEQGALLTFVTPKFCIQAYFCPVLFSPFFTCK